MKPGVKIFLGIFTSLATIAFIFIYDIYIKDKIDSVEVVVVKAGDKILKSEPILLENLTTEKRKKESLIEDVVLAEDIESILGFDAKQDIMGNSMISKQMVDFEDLVPDEEKGEAIRPITSDMIYAKPGSLRRKDSINIYLVYPDGSTNFQTNGPSVVSSETESTEHENNDSEIEESTNESTEQNTNTNVNEKYIATTEPFLTNVRVVYVKDSSNQEVISTTEKPNRDDEKRLNASSSISDLEVILNETDFSMLMNEVLSKKAQLYITYQ